LATRFHVQIMASNRAYYEGLCEYVSVPTTEGIVGVLAHHENLIMPIVPGVLEVDTVDEKTDVVIREIAAISSGLLKVENNTVMILADTIERPEEIDTNRAKRAEDIAKEALLQKKSMIEYKQAEISLARAANRLKVSKIRGKK